MQSVSLSLSVFLMTVTRKNKINHSVGSMHPKENYLRWCPNMTMIRRLKQVKGEKKENIKEYKHECCVYIHQQSGTLRKWCHYVFICLSPSLSLKEHTHAHTSSWACTHTHSHTCLFIHISDTTIF